MSFYNLDNSCPKKNSGKNIRFLKVVFFTFFYGFMRGNLYWQAKNLQSGLK